MCRQDTVVLGNYSNNYRQTPFFFLENSLKKKTTEYFFKFLFLFETTILPVNNGK